MSNRFPKRVCFRGALIALSIWMIAVSCRITGKDDLQAARKKNILFAISDDQSWLHTSAAGCSFVETPVFDRVVAKGVCFENAYAAAPQCSPNRAAILTGKPVWQLEEAGTHSSYFPKKFTVFTSLLDSAGYHVGYTGKAWNPGNFEDAGWLHNPVGKAFNDRRLQEKPTTGINGIDYFANFTNFMESRDGKPFFFWFGASEPHRKYEEGSGVHAGKSLEDAMIPGFLPDDKDVRSDLLDYALEIEWFDRQLGKMLDYLDSIGELDNTLIVVTSDNGMPFPRAKANLYEYGVHLPLAVYMPGMKRSGKVQELVSFTDFAPTFLEFAGLNVPAGMTGKSLIPLLNDEAESLHENVFFGRERHTHARPDNLGYPSRGVRSGDFLYIRNFEPDRWPAGDPPVEALPEGYYDIDDGLSKRVVSRPGFKKYLEMSVAKRPAEELYNVKEDPECLNNLAGSLPQIRQRLSDLLMKQLTADNDPRATGRGDIFESYPRFGAMRPYPGFIKRGEYNPDYQ